MRKVVATRRYIWDKHRSVYVLCPGPLWVLSVVGCVWYKPDWCGIRRSSSGSQPWEWARAHTCHVNMTRRSGARGSCCRYFWETNTALHCCTTSFGGAPTTIDFGAVFWDISCDLRAILLPRHLVGRQVSPGAGSRWPFDRRVGPVPGAPSCLVSPKIKNLKFSLKPKIFAQTQNFHQNTKFHLNPKFSPEPKNFAQAQHFHPNIKFSPKQIFSPKPHFFYPVACTPVLESFKSHLGVIWGSFGDHIGVIWGSFWGNFNVIWVN